MYNLEYCCVNHVYTFPVKYIQIVVYHYNTEFHIYYIILL